MLVSTRAGGFSLNRTPGIPVRPTGSANRLMKKEIVYYLTYFSCNSQEFVRGAVDNLILFRYITEYIIEHYEKLLNLCPQGSIFFSSIFHQNLLCVFWPDYN